MGAKSGIKRKSNYFNRNWNDHRDHCDLTVGGVTSQSDRSPLPPGSLPPSAPLSFVLRLREPRWASGSSAGRLCSRPHGSNSLRLTDWLLFALTTKPPPPLPFSPPPQTPPPRAAPVRNPIFPKQPLHLKVTCCLSEPVACAAQPVIDPIIVLLEGGWGGFGEEGASTGSRWGQVTSRIMSELRAGFQLSGTLWRSDLEATFMCFLVTKRDEQDVGLTGSF